MMDTASPIRRTRSGAVDVAHYQARARCLRSAALRQWLQRAGITGRRKSAAKPATTRCAGYQA